jgi:hypothetical protein
MRRRIRHRHYIRRPDDLDWQIPMPKTVQLRTNFILNPDKDDSHVRIFSRREDRSFDLSPGRMIATHGIKSYGNHVGHR